jgi:hypothetical protein
MAGITRREREDKARIADIKLKLKEPMALYLYAKLNSALTALQDKQDKRIAERKAKVEADRKAAKRVVFHSVLPDNGRLLRVPAPTQVQPFVIPAGINKG